MCACVYGEIFDCFTGMAAVIACARTSDCTGWKDKWSRPVAVDENDAAASFDATTFPARLIRAQVDCFVMESKTMAAQCTVPNAAH